MTASVWMAFAGRSAPDGIAMIVMGNLSLAIWPGRASASISPSVAASFEDMFRASPDIAVWVDPAFGRHDTPGTMAAAIKSIPKDKPLLA